MEVLKRARAAEFVGFAGGLFSTIPTPIWAAIGPVASQLPLSLCNIICTNIPGPQVPLYLLGHKMLSWYPYVPIGGEMGLNCAILSYNGMAYFGFTCDVGAVPDPEHLEKFVTMSCAELRKAGKSGKPAVNSPPETKQAERKPARRQRPKCGDTGDGEAGSQSDSRQQRRWPPNLRRKPSLNHRARSRWRRRETRVEHRFQRSLNPVFDQLARACAVAGLRWRR